MNSFLIIFIGLGSMVILAAGFLWLNDRFLDWRHRDRRTPQEKLREDAVLFARLQNPKWDEIEKITGGRPSMALLGLYTDYKLIHRKDFCILNPAPDGQQLPYERILAFRPADAVAMMDEWCQMLPQGAFPFATDECGDLLFVEQNKAGDDLPVKHWFHDSAKAEYSIGIVAPSLAVFLSWQRTDSPLPE